MAGTTVTRTPYMSGYKYTIDGVKVPSVTTILSKALSKPALTTWAAKTVAAYAVDHWRELSRVPVSERLSRLQGAPWNDRDSAALKGTQVHAIAEKLVHGLEPGNGYPAQAKACAAFLRDFHVEPLHTETALFSRRFGYAGTADLIAMIGGETVLIDYKTNRSGIFPDIAYQLCAYSRCDVLLSAETEVAMPVIDRAIGVHIREDGYSAIPVLINDDVFDVFLALQRVAEAKPEDYLGQSLSAEYA